MECDCFGTHSLYVLSFFLFKPNSLRSTYVDRVWSPDGLKVQYRADDNVTTLPLTWKGICGTPPTSSDYTIVISGGSSTGGAYQFKDEPQAFFLHQNPSRSLPDFTTQYKTLSLIMVLPI